MTGYNFAYFLYSNVTGKVARRSGTAVKFTVTDRNGGFIPFDF